MAVLTARARELKIFLALKDTTKLCVAYNEAARNLYDQWGVGSRPHPGGNPGANLKSIAHICHPILVAFVWELTKETIVLPLSCLQGGATFLVKGLGLRGCVIGIQG